MKKELGEVTLYELAKECTYHEECDLCPFGDTWLNCWNASKMLTQNDGHLLDTEVEI